MNLITFAQSIPKAELHLHIEGSFEPELMFEIARRNNIPIPYNSINEVKAAYNFNNLQEFLDIYYAGAGVLIHKQDFYDLTYAYLCRAANDNVKHVEIFFDPQTHTHRGISFETVIEGILEALHDARKNLDLSSYLIMSYLRHLDEDDAIRTLQQSLPYRDHITAVGLDSSELGNPPSKFAEVFSLSRDQGYKLCAHAGEEGPAEYIWEALTLLNVDRIDHGNRCLDDLKLITELSNRQIGLTICPLSNDKLQVVSDLSEHPIKTMLEHNLKATINSDDPAYFGGYINQNFTDLITPIGLNEQNIIQLAKNSFQTSFLPDTEIETYLDMIDNYVQLMPQ
ncbi:Adenine deaminase [Poriferisphaera corsica]|uniref:Adenine deaminase n=1 Tax=Poriferisphaera corsica TaxID=2528020 RepID=A0A517YU05_9BACT|nr:adenosine deaminase [Poriferisphaera corsica]QDU33697.1 Adenine deaminase [Poriferisphaera corsica]